MIEFDRTLTHPWAADCQGDDWLSVARIGGLSALLDWGSVALGSIDPTLRAVTASPSVVTSGTG